MRRAPLPLRSPPSVPSHPLPCATAWRRGGASCGGSQLLQRGAQPELRWQAAGQVAVAKQPARGAPEREEGWREVPVGASDPRRAADTRCAPPLRDATTLRHHPYARGRPPSPPSAALPTPLCKQVSTPFRRAAFVGGTRRAVQRSAQFGVAVSAVADRRIVGGECDTRVSPTRRCPLSPPTPTPTTLRTFPPPTLLRLGGGGAEVRWLTGTPAR